MNSYKNILEVDNLTFSFNVNPQRSLTFRDFFTRKKYSKKYSELYGDEHKVWIAKNISFRAAQGESIGILGINGAGKTSLCKCIAGVYPRFKGRIKTVGKIRSVFDSSLGIQPELTGRENAKILVDLIFPIDNDKKEILNEALDFSELGRFLDVPYKLYSTGMKSRLFLPIVSAKASDIFILDEVFNGADTSFAHKMSDRMSNIISKSSLVIFVSHTFEHVRRVCNRVIVLHSGEIIFDGEPEEGINFYTQMFSNGGENVN